MKVIKVALVSQTKKISASELRKVAAAINRQLKEHFEPVWKIAAEMKPFSRSSDVPHDYWRIFVRDQPCGHLLLATTLWKCSLMGKRSEL